MATWAYPSLPPKDLERKADEALVCGTVYSRVNQNLAYPMIGKRTRMVAAFLAGFPRFVEKRPSRLRRASCSQRARVDSGPVIP